MSLKVCNLFVLEMYSERIPSVALTRRPPYLLRKEFRKKVEVDRVQELRGE